MEVLETLNQALTRGRGIPALRIFTGNRNVAPTGSDYWGKNYFPEPLPPTPVSSSRHEPSACRRRGLRMLGRRLLA